MHNVTVANTA